MTNMFRKSEKFAAKVSLAKQRNDVNPSDYDSTTRRDSIKQANFFVDDDQVKLEQSKHDQLLKNKQQIVLESKKPSCIENMTPFVLMIGLGVHATFEGLSLGMSSDFDSTLLFAIAIVLHKGAAGMSLGISMGKTFPD